MLTTAQTSGLYTPAYVRAQLAARRWQRPARGVVVTHNGPLTECQAAWVALLRCPHGTALAALTALGFDGVNGFPEPKPHVVLPAGADRPSGVVPHWSTELSTLDVHPLRLPRRTRPARSTVDAASWQTNERRARAIVLSVAQQRIVQPAGLWDALSRRGPCRHRALIKESILDAAGGVQSLPEHDFEMIRRGRRLPEPNRQSIRQRNDGRYYLDVEWRAFDAACEVHGIPHLRVMQWEADLERANEISIGGPRLLIFSSYATRRQQDRVGDQLARLLRRGGWRG
ncbi:MAG: hypothetical protein H0V23_08690 [Nocardioidaceae bacterium]|nr:hypothetical protein [Nocardioidaceae bacterium]